PFFCPPKWANPLRNSAHSWGSPPTHQRSRMHKGTSPMAGILISEGPFMAFTLKFARSRLFIRAVGPMCDEQRRRLKAWKRAHGRVAADWKVRYGDSIPVPVYPIFPDGLVGLSCGARTRLGDSCKQPALLPSGRCRYHGGASTGPRTAAGKAKSAANG